MDSQIDFYPPADVADPSKSMILSKKIFRRYWGRRDEFERSMTTVDDQHATVFHDRSLSLSKSGLVETMFAVGAAETASRAQAFSEASFNYGLSDSCRDYAATLCSTPSLSARRISSIGSTV